MPVVNDYTALISGNSLHGRLADLPVQSAIVTYSFSTTAQGHLGAAGYSQSFIDSFQAFNATQMTQARAAMDQFAAASGIIAIEVAAGEGTIQLGNFDFTQHAGLTGTAGFAYLPSAAVYENFGGFYGNSFFATNAVDGDVLISRSFAANPANNASMAYVLIHEIGHALGLKHPFEGDVTLSAASDNGNNTVMSYNAPRNTTLGTLDVQALQAMYGSNAADGSHLASYNYNATARVLTQVGTSADNTIFGVRGRDDIQGGVGDDVLIGMAGDDTLNGGTGADVVFGGLGNDIVQGDAGNDQLFGDDGYGEAAALHVDTLDYSAATSALDVRLDNQRSSGGVNYHASGADIGLDYLESFDRFVLGSGGDTFVAGSASATVFGRGGVDQLTGGAGNDVLAGGAGADMLNGGAGTDSASYSDATGGIIAFLGSNFYNSGDAVGDVYTSIEGLIGSEMDDILGGDNLVNTIQGGGGNDWLFGAGGNDLLQGGGGNDILSGGAGGDTLDGGAGVDVAYYREATAGVTVNLVDRTQNAGEAQGDLISNTENLWGSDHADVLTGDGGNNQVYGFGGVDTLFGGAGDDAMYGAAGGDTINAGTGADTFFFLFANEGGDTINSFEHGVDRLFFSQYWFGIVVPGPAASIDPGLFVSGANATSQAARPQFLYNTSTNALWFDADGTGAQAAVHMASFSAGTTITSEDLWRA